MMACHAAKERNQGQWERLIDDAGLKLVYQRGYEGVVGPRSVTSCSFYQERKNVGNRVFEKYIYTNKFITGH